MRTRDDIWLPEQDTWGADRLVWDEDEDPREDHDDDEPVREDPRY
jgi:hypothetical protein